MTRNQDPNSQAPLPVSLAPPRKGQGEETAEQFSGVREVFHHHVHTHRKSKLNDMTNFDGQDPNLQNPTPDALNKCLEEGKAQPELLMPEMSPAALTLPAPGTLLAQATGTAGGAAAHDRRGTSSSNHPFRVPLPPLPPKQQSSTENTNNRQQQRTSPTPSWPT